MPNTVSYNNEVVADVGGLPKLGTQAKDFSYSFNKFTGLGSTKRLKNKKIIILNILPNVVERDISKKSIQHLLQQYKSCDDVVVLNIVSMDACIDVPFLVDNGKLIAHVVQPEIFAKSYGVKLMFRDPDNAKLGLHLARSIIVLDTTFRVAYTQLVEDLGQEPNYQACLESVAALRKSNVNPAIGEAKTYGDINASQGKPKQMPPPPLKPSKLSVQTLEMQQQKIIQAKQQAYAKAQTNVSSNYVNYDFMPKRNLFELLLMKEITDCYARIIDVNGESSTSGSNAGSSPEPSPNNTMKLRSEIIKMSRLSELARVRQVLFKNASNFQKLLETLFEKLRSSILAKYLPNEEVLMDFINGAVVLCAKNLVLSGVEELEHFTESVNLSIKMCLDAFANLEQDNSKLKIDKLNKALQTIVIRESIQKEIYEAFQNSFNEVGLNKVLVSRTFAYPLQKNESEVQDSKVQHEEVQDKGENLDNVEDSIPPTNGIVQEISVADDFNDERDGCLSQKEEPDTTSDDISAVKQETKKDSGLGLSQQFQATTQKFQQEPEMPYVMPPLSSRILQFSHQFPVPLSIKGPVGSFQNIELDIPKFAVVKTDGVKGKPAARELFVD